MIKKIVRDNEILNPVVRIIVRFLQRFSKSIAKVTSHYRVYGTVKLIVEGVEFKIFTASDDHIANEIFYNQGYESAEFRLVNELIKSGRFFIDVGANTGIFSIYVAIANPSIKILSFEPHPSNFIRLQKNLEINQLVNIEAFQIALGEKEGSIEFTIPADMSLSTTSSANEIFARNFHKISHKIIHVKQLTLDRALSNYDIASSDVIKVDVEYYELHVLKGAIATLTEKKPLLLIEILQYDRLVEQFPEMSEKINKNHASEIQEFLFGLGYFPYAIEKDGIRAIDSVLSKQNNRNFLFSNRKIMNCYLPFDKIRAAFIETE